jgi:hypothetical protein
MRRDIPGRGELKLRVKYRMQVLIRRVGT